MKRFLFCLTLSILCVAGITGHAQIYPIQSQVNLTPPYSGNLSDYTFPGSQRITVTLNCNDITISNYRVKLRFNIEGLGITLRSKTSLSLEPFIIDGGSPLLLYGDDLAQYLDPRNLDFIGISRTEYQRAGKLPEGVYRFYVEVLDYNRGTVVSNKGFATAWVILNDPPILNLPANNSKARVIDPTNIPFTWTPRHSSSPNSAFTSEYVFRLVEIWPSNRNPNDAFLSQTPLYEVETSRTQLVYGPGEPMLIPGRKYAWQVQAKDSEGRDLFKNNGKSEVFVFQFGDAIEMPQNVRKETANASTISIRWEASTAGEIPERFRIRYRPEGGTIWFEDVTTNYWHTLSGLQNNKAYDVQVRAETSRQVSDYTFNQRYNTTLPIVDEDFQCGNPFNIVPPVMTTPLQYLNPGDVFKCADFDVMVTEVTKSPTPGSFSGKGYAKVLMMNRANIEVTFGGTFNSERQMVTGSIKTTYQSGSKMAQLTEVMKKIGEKPPVLDSAAINPDSNLIIITGVIDSVYFNSNGDIVVLDEGGSTQTFEQKKNGQGEKQEMIVKDSTGNTWTVDKDGKITAAESAVAGVFSSRDSLNFTVNFKENSSDQYGFDKDSNFPTLDKIQINAADYIVGWKSVEQGKQDFVDAFTLTENKFPKKVGFKIESQPMSLQPGTEPNSAKLILPGALHGDRQELIAYAKLKEPGSATETEVVLGKLKVATYEYISRKVIIVPVNGVTPPVGLDVQAKLNKIYSQAVAGWQVTIADTFKVAPAMLSKFDEEESGTFASYNKKMREFNSAYRSANPTYDRNAFYIFLIPGGGYRFNGFMPFKRQFGYVFVNKTSNQVHTIAHELGHGAFNLRHPFDEYSLAKDATENLMDYKGGEELKKYQWDYVHDPESMVGWLQDDEDAAYESAGIIQIQNSSNLQLDPANIKINYKLKEWQKKIDASSFESKKIEDYNLLLFVVRNNEVVYSFSKELTETGNIEWHGLVSADEEAMTIDNYKEFSLHVGITSKSNAVNEPFLNYQALLGSRPETTLLKYGNEQSSQVKFVDVIQGIKFKLNFAKSEWQKFIRKDNILLATEVAYQASRESYIERLEEIGVDTDKVSPIDYLNEHLVSGDFLGMPVYGINIRYLYVLRKIEEQLGRRQNWSQSSAPFTNYVNDLRADGMYLQDIARMSNVKESLSDHATGFALDFRKEDNIWIRSGSNDIVAKYIELVTGAKMLSNAYSIDQSKAFHNQFIERVVANKITIHNAEEPFNTLNQIEALVIEGLDSLPEYAIKMKKLSQDLTEQLEKDTINIEKLRLTKTQIETILGEVDLFILHFREFKAQADLALFTNYFNSDLSLSVDQTLSTLSALISDYKKQIDMISTSAVSNSNSLEIHPFTEQSILSNTTHLASYLEKFTQRKQVVGMPLSQFGKDLVNKLKNTSIYYGSKILDVGFFSLQADLVKAIVNKSITAEGAAVNVKWGGHYAHSKDFMHFEIKPEPGDRSHQVAVGKLDLALIRNYLNSFSKEDNSNYSY